MSRVSYSMMNPGGAALMTAAVREALCGLAVDVAHQAGITHEDILEATLVGNPIMHHLLLGIDPVGARRARRFALATDHSLTLRGERHRFQIAPQRADLRAGRASPGMSARMRREWCSPSARISPRR